MKGLVHSENNGKSLRRGGSSKSIKNSLRFGNELVQKKIYGNNIFFW